MPNYNRRCAEYMAFTAENPTTYHAIDSFEKTLQNAGFRRLAEGEVCEVDAGKYYVTRNGQALVALVVGKLWQPRNGVGVVAGHVDAITNKLKPTSIKENIHGYELLGVAPYSGGLVHQWLDRDLGIAGALIVNENGERKRRLVSSGLYPIARIPSLAPHFGGASKLPYNPETQMVPVIGFGSDSVEPTEAEKRAPLYGKHSLLVLRYVAKLAGVDVAQIEDVDLDLFDVQAPSRGGINGDFMFAPRIDDRLCSFAAVHALVKLSPDSESHSDFSIAYCVNHEEVGSGSRTGAKGNLLNSVVESVVTHKAGRPLENIPLAWANSVLLSADVTHLFNPNFPHAYLENHFPLPNVGLTLKKDALQRVMTELVGIVLMEEIARRNGLQLQQFHVRNDMPSGGTIGPMLATGTGARVIDVGLAQLSMHSIRAAAGYKEPGLGIEAFAAFYRDWRAVLDKIDAA